MYEENICVSQFTNAFKKKVASAMSNISYWTILNTILHSLAVFENLPDRLLPLVCVR